MRYIKKTAVLFLILAVVFGLAACTNKLTGKDFISEFEAYGLKESDKVETYGDEEYGKTGTESNITYCIDSGVSAAGSNKIGTGVYLQGNVLVFMRAKSAVNDNYVFADTICSKFGLISPSTAE